MGFPLRAEDYSLAYRWVHHGKMRWPSVAAGHLRLSYVDDMSVIVSDRSQRGVMPDLQRSAINVRFASPLDAPQQSSLRYSMRPAAAYAI